VGQQAVQRLGDAAEVEGVDQQPGVAVLAAAAGAQEAVQQPGQGPLPLGGLALEGPERPELPLALDQPLHGGGAEAADQLVLQVGLAHEEAERGQLGPAEIRAEAGPLQTAPEVDLLAGVAEAGQGQAQPSGTEPLQEPPDAPGPAHRDDDDALGGEVPAAAGGQGLEGDLVAGPLDQHDHAGVGAGDHLSAS
jgi:hypothetical protein